MLTRKRETSLILDPMFRIRIAGDQVAWSTTGKSGTSSAQELLLHLESVCDSLKHELGWQKTRSGHAKMSLASAEDGISIGNADDDSVGISIEPGRTNGR